GALAAAGPRARARPAQRTWRAIVDRSPSTSLPLGTGTRLDKAIALAKDWLSSGGRSRDEVVWIDSGSPSAEPPWGELDREDALFVTDRLPEPAPRRAGVFASGGPAVPGPVSVAGDTRYDWDGERLVEVKGGAPARTIAFECLPLPPVLERVVRVWAGARGLAFAKGAAPDAALVIECSSTGAARAVEAGRDGWLERGTVGDLAVRAGLETWLADAGGRALVASGPGRVA